MLSGCSQQNTVNQTESEVSEAQMQENSENIETEKYPPFREWRIPFFIKNYSTITCIILKNTIFFNNRMQA